MTRCPITVWWAAGAATMLECMQTQLGTTRPLSPSSMPRRLVPGLALAVAAAVLAWGIQQIVPALSALLVAIILGVIVTHVWRIPDVFDPGMAVAAKDLLRLGIVFLGLQLALDDILALGWGVLAVVVAIVALGILGTLLLGRWFGVPRQLTLLVACGFSICGAAAVAGVEGSTDADEEDVASAIGLVVLFGTIMIVLVPLVLGPLGMSERTQGLIAGGSIHEIAQVVAAGGIIGGGALAVAVVVKLARVLMLAPVVFLLALVQRRKGDVREGTSLPPIVPLFIVGFLAMALVRTFVTLPPVALDGGRILQTLTLGAAMFALGTGVHISLLTKVGGRSLVLGVASTALVFILAFAGMTVLG